MLFSYYLALESSHLGKRAFAVAAERTINWYNNFGDLLIIKKHILCITLPIYIETLESMYTL